jgi:CMP-N-acetylneuraminic acid synthetase
MGVPGKNTRELLGKPVIDYTIEAALAAQRLDRIALTTDDEQVKAICRQRYNSQVVLLERPTELAGDTARIDDAMRHCCAVLKDQYAYEPDAVALLYANVPVRAAGIIDQAIERLEQTGADSVQTLASVGKFHPYWLYQLEGDKAAKYIDNQVYQRQDLPKLYMIDGAVGVVKYETLLAAEGDDDPHAFWGRDRRGLEQEAHETVDIDTPRDMFMAEAVLRSREHERTG